MQKQACLWIHSFSRHSQPQCSPSAVLQPAPVHPQCSPAALAMAACTMVPAEPFLTARASSVLIPEEPASGSTGLQVEGERGH